MWKQGVKCWPFQVTRDQRIPFSHVFIDTLTYSNLSLCIWRALHMKSIDKKPTGKIFLQYENQQGINISNINETTENQQYKEKKRFKEAIHTKGIQNSLQMWASQRL